MKRVMIVGGPGSGKTTLALRLAELTRLPVYHMDRIHWQPGWVEREAAEKLRLVRMIHACEEWIFEGGHSQSYDERLERADTLIWLDLPLWRRYLRAFRRLVANFGRSRPDIADNCPERLNREYLLFLAFIWNSRHSARKPLLAILANPPRHVQIHHLTSPNEVAELVTNISARHHAATG
ncbi:AAA family ATPase [Rhodobacteraceae bacterium NNCM2]|nr:AAA family ATPase [Coraliihabitans acroporae]